MLEKLIESNMVPNDVKNLICGVTISDPDAMRYLLQLMVLSSPSHSIRIPFNMLDSTSPNFVSGSGALMFGVDHDHMTVYFVPGNRTQTDQLMEEINKRRTSDDKVPAERADIISPVPATKTVQ